MTANTGLKRRHKAQRLRKLGYSFREISLALNIAKSTASLWTREVTLSKQAQQRLRRLTIIGQKNSTATLKAASKIREKNIKHLAQTQVVKLSQLDQQTTKLLLAILYGCEGAKTDRGARLTFINSDPRLIVTFIKLFKSVYKTKNDRWRGCLHLHTYHNAKKQIRYWSELTKIPTTQLSTYIKRSDHKRKRTDYPGCLSLRYYDSTIAKELYYLYKGFIGA